MATATLHSHCHGGMMKTSISLKTPSQPSPNHKSSSQPPTIPKPTPLVPHHNPLMPPYLLRPLLLNPHQPSRHP